MYQIVVMAMLLEILQRETSKGIGLGKSAGQLAGLFDDVAQGTQMFWPQGTQPVFEQIEAR